MERNKSYIISDAGMVTELSSHGIYFARGGVAELFTLPLLDDPITNDWQEEDGLEVDVKSLTTKVPSIELRMVVFGKTRMEYSSGLNAFRALFKSDEVRIKPAYFERDQIYKLTDITIEGITSHGGLYTSGAKWAEVTIGARLSEWSEVTLPLVTPSPLTRVSIDGRDLVAYGVQIQEAYNTLLLPASYKERTLMSMSKELALQCIVIADSYKIIAGRLCTLSQAIMRKIITMKHGGGEGQCYYTSMTDLREIPMNGRRAITFALNFKTI